MKAVIFGVNGQDGFYLSELLRRENVKAVGVSRSDGDWIKGDVSHFDFVESIVKQHKPDYIFHLAANSTTSHNAIFENHASISTGTFNILENVRLFSTKTKVFLSGSAVQFENNGKPIDEKTAFAANSPYAVSRIQSVYAGRYFRHNFGLSVYAGYFFNHDSPLRTDKHINQKIVSFVKNIDGKLEIGDVTVEKEFNFAGDVVKAVWQLVNQNQIFEAVIGSGEAYKIEDWLEICFRSVNKDWQDFVKIKPKFQSEYKTLVSNPNLIKSLGWQPGISIEELAEMMLKN